MKPPRNTRLQMAAPEHEVTYQELVQLVKRHAGEMSAAEILAVAANMVGKLIAMQDQSLMTVDEALRMVSENIDLGNQQAIAALKHTEGSA